MYIWDSIGYKVYLMQKFGFKSSSVCKENNCDQNIMYHCKGKNNFLYNQLWHLLKKKGFVKNQCVILPKTFIVVFYKFLVTFDIIKKIY